MLCSFCLLQKFSLASQGQGAGESQNEVKGGLTLFSHPLLFGFESKDTGAGRMHGDGGNCKWLCIVYLELIVCLCFIFREKGKQNFSRIK